MNFVRAMVALLLCFVLPASVFAADATSGYKVTYDGGSLPDSKVGAGMKLVIKDNNVTFLKDSTQVISVPASSITEISY